MPNSLPQTSLYVPSAYQKLFCQLGNNLQTEVQSISLTRVDGGARATTMVKGYAGRTMGAPVSTGTLRGIVPYVLTDSSGGGGVGFGSAGITIGGAFLQIDQSMLTNYNQNLSLPVSILIQIGQPAAQQIVVVGYFTDMMIDSADGKNLDFTANFEGTFNVFGTQSGLVL